MGILPEVSDSIHIRRLGPDDADEWRTLTQRRERLTASDPSVAHPPTHDDRNDPNALTSRPAHGSTYGAIIGGALVGCVRVQASDGSDTWTIGALYVDPVARRRGIGTLLISVALAAVPPGRPVELWVPTEAACGAAAVMYERLGFAVTSPELTSGPQGHTHIWRRGR